MSATVIIPTTGTPEVEKAINSVLNQSYLTTCYVVCDGKEHLDKVAILSLKNNWGNNPKFKLCVLPINVGAKGFYGHRVYAAFTHLVDTEYVSYLDQDCWIEPNHIKTCVEKIRKNKLDWSYSLRKIVDKDENYLCNDDCESLGKWQCFQNYHHVDTNCYCLRTDIAIQLASVWHGGWGQDRVFLKTIMTHFTKFDCSGEYTVNYRLAGNEGSVKKDFFVQGNEVMEARYGKKLPWRNY